MAKTRLQSIKAEVKRERDLAWSDARSTNRFVISRGTWLATLDTRGNQCDPRPEAECPEWHGTMREIAELIALVEAKYPNVAKVYIAGGYDGARSLHHYNEWQEYEPWVSSWTVDVWTRPTEEVKS